MKKSKIIKGLSYAACLIEGILIVPIGINYPRFLLIMIPLILFTTVGMPIIFTRMASAGK